MTVVQSCGRCRFFQPDRKAERWGRCVWIPPFCVTGLIPSIIGTEVLRTKATCGTGCPVFEVRSDA